MVKDKVTKDDLEKFVVGDQKVFTLPSFEKTQSAASLAYQMKNFTKTFGWKFRAIISDPVEGSMQRSITITRLS